MAKLNRESKLRDKRAEKQARKVARKLSLASDAAQAASPSEELGVGSVGIDPGAPDGAEPVPVTATARKDDR
jgi:hypothetical protein